MLFILTFALCLQSKPELEFVVKENPEYVLISQSSDFVVEIQNKGSGEALGVEITAEENFVSVSAPKIASLGESGSIPVNVSVSASQLAEGDNAFTLKAVWHDSGGETSTVTKKIKFSVRKPSVVIEKVESGLLPGKIRITTNEKKVISVTIKNREEARLSNFSLVFFSKYPHFTISREGMAEVPSDGRKYSFTLEEYFSQGDVASKSFTLSVALPQGTNSASFTLQVMLYWNNYLIDTAELEVVVNGTAS